MKLEIGMAQYLIIIKVQFQFTGHSQDLFENVLQKPLIIIVYNSFFSLLLQKLLGEKIFPRYQLYFPTSLENMEEHLVVSYTCTI